MGPRVSIVMPTLNRSHLLRFSLRSAVEQSYPDLEIVVSNNRSTDATAEVIRSFDHPGLKVVVPERRLTMPENFEFGLDNASGDYITFITDDTYLLPHCIERSIEEMLRLDVPILVWTNAIYVDPRWIEPQRRNTLYIPRSSYSGRLRDSRESLEAWFRRIRDAADKPRAINSLCHRSVIDAARTAQGAFFLPPAPDHSAGVGMLMNSRRYVYLDEPLVIDVLAPESTGASSSFTMGKAAQEVWRSFGTDLTSVAFLGLPTNSGAVAQSMKAVRGYYGERCPDLDLLNVLSEIVDNIAKLEAYGSDVSTFYRTVFAHARRFSPGFRLRLALKRLISPIKWRIVRLIRSSPLLYRLEMVRGFAVIRLPRDDMDVAEVAAIVRSHISAARARHVDGVPGASR